MDDIKLNLISSILNFLRGEYRAGYLDAENNEGLEVAIHCLENIYDVSKAVHRSNEPTLLEVYKSYLENAVFGYRDATEAERSEAEILKVEGNAAMSAGKFAEAINLYTRAIQYNPKNAVYYCNRAAAKSKLNDHMSAIDDCKLAIALDPKYSKAYGRLGLAYCGLESYVNALENYKKAYDLEPDNEGYRRNFELAQQRVADLCCCNLSHHNQSSTNVQNPNFSAENASNAGNQGAHAMESPFDINSLLGNQQLVNIASQMLTDPAMQNMMTAILNQDSGNGVHALLEAGQTLARQMQSENPDFFNQLRQTFTESTPGGAEQATFPHREGSDRPDSDASGGEPSREKNQ